LDEPRDQILRVGARAPVTEVEGPGRRYALWVQGCSIRCAACCNPHFFPAAAGQAVCVSDLLAEVVSVRARIEGLTFLGGEPFEQAAPLAHLAAAARDLGLSVMAFTGFTLRELRGRSEPGVHALLEQVDVLVDGPFEAARPERERRWVGSENQHFHYLTRRYTSAIETPSAAEPLRAVEVIVGVDGRVVVNGWPVVKPGR
jgi:anaerobic ribonucleoside-triphosphate reductase activating protein